MGNILWVLFWMAVAFILYEYVDVITGNIWILVAVIAGIFGIKFLWSFFNNR